MSRTLAALLTTLVVVCAHADPMDASQTEPPRVGPEDGLLVVTVDGKYGFIDLNGQIVIAPRFDYARGFFEGRAAVWLNGRVGFIDRTGQYVIAPRFENAIAFRDGLGQVPLGDLRGFVGTGVPQTA